MMTRQELLEQLVELFKLIKHFEGCFLTPYLCPARVWTCGWGSTGPDVFPGRPWTQEYADMRLENDAVKFAIGTLALCPRLRGDQLSAIADFAYNLGLGRLRASTLRKKLNADDMEGAARELMKWIKAGGRVLRGLVIRRSAEAQLMQRAA